MILNKLIVSFLQYATLLLILLIAEVAIAVVFYTHQDDLKELVKKGLSESIDKYNEGQKEVVEVWDTMQQFQ